MSLDLDVWQTRLEQHFAALWKERGIQKLPVFALEHGLPPEEMAAAAKLLDARLRSGGPRLGKHWLVWVVFAAEQGYDYDGAEYWTTFEQRMPMWSWSVSRSNLRVWFGKFHQQYGGLKPTGPWAVQFSIIAWPITHAILPKDLQYQLARTLYTLRYQLAAKINNSPKEIGHYVAKSVYDASSRFKNFLQQEELAGRIILALLDGGEVTEQRAIDPQTLARIKRDLEAARNARQWLRDARRVVQDRLIKGAASPARPAQPGSAGISKEKPREPSIRPALSLRRTAIGEWTAVLEIPSFREVADLAPELGQFLRRTRCAVAGSAGFLPAGWLLTGQQRRVLTSWPANGAPLLKFESANLALEHLLQSEFLSTPGPIWVFRIGPDGVAMEIVSRIVRPGRTYVMVTSGTLPESRLCTPASIKCTGVVAVELAVPTALSAEQISDLQGMGLSVARTVRIWPAGLGARAWDGEGTTEWLEGEVACFGIEHDHPIEAYEMQVDGGEKALIPALEVGVPTFVRLPLLPPGRHTLVVSAKRGLISEDDVQLAPVEGVMSLTVRPPSPWMSGLIGHTGMIVTAEPPEPTLDEFWEGESSIHIMGPGGHHVSVWVELLDGAGQRIAQEQIAGLTLPLGSDTWRSAFATFARRDTNPWAYLSASSGRLVVDGEELGVAHIALQRVVAPVRWVWHVTGRSTLLRVVDDHEGDVPPEISMYEFGKPNVAIPIAGNALDQGFEPANPGGLYVARYGDQTETLIVSSQQVTGGLGGLLIDPDLSAVPESMASVKSLLSAIRLWSGARLVGTLAADRRNRVVDRLKACLFRVLCGQQWAYAEAEFARRNGDAASRARLIDAVHAKRAFALVLADDARRYVQMPRHVRFREFSALAARYEMRSAAVCQSALDLCEYLEREAGWPPSEIEAHIARLWDNQGVVAGARLMWLVGGGAIAQPARSQDRMAS